MQNLFILTLTWNACDRLTKLKESLVPALSGINYNWLIKDNASNDDTVKVASEWGDNIKVIPYKNNLQNFSEGMNYLFNVAAPQDNDLILLLNNDVIFNDKKSIHNMIKLINKDNDIGMVGARLLFTNTNKIQHGGVVFSSYKTPHHFRAYQPTDTNAEKNRQFQVVTGAVALTKAEYFKNCCTQNKSGINGMDEKYSWAFDDVDLCLSIKYNLNKKIVYCGETNIFHEESASLKKNSVNKLFLNNNLSHLMKKWDGRYILDQDSYNKFPNYNLY